MGKQYNQLSAEERGQGLSARQMARILDRASSTIARELRRDRFRFAGASSLRWRPGLRAGYDATRAGARARRLRKRPRVQRKMRPGTALGRRVCRLRERCGSPQPIARKLRTQDPQHPWLRVSHATIGDTEDGKHRGPQAPSHDSFRKTPSASSFVGKIGAISNWICQVSVGDEDPIHAR